ncbi:MAG: glycosyltransferase family 4 protein [Rhizobiaceae bacterium]|nr:glycosyltransferase family 4 protein [Rhizobiaceae bacterium]
MSRSAEPHRVMFLYWGRRGALVRFALEAWRAAAAESLLDPTLSVARSNERFSEFEAFGGRLFPVSTFQTSREALVRSLSIGGLRRDLLARLRLDRTQTAVTLLSHVWSPLVAPVFRKAGVRTVTLVHDADPHPGDRTGLLQNWYQRDIAKADRIVTLSRSVRDSLVTDNGPPPAKILTLLHPDFASSRPGGAPNAAKQGPFRLLFLGRILPYKGLGRAIAAVEILHARGIDVRLSIYGEGDVEPYRQRLGALGAIVVNRWLSDDEIDTALASHDALVLSHVEASQSGVAALALGSGLPIVATPVGGLVEQVTDGETGVLAAGTDPADIAFAIARLAADGTLRRHICSVIAARRAGRSMQAFVHALALHLSRG